MMLKTKTVGSLLAAFSVGASIALLVSRGDNVQAAAGGKPEIIFYSEPDFQGRELHILEDTVDLPFEDLADGAQMLWNDNIGSILVVSGTWRVYQHGRMNTVLDDTPRAALDVYSKPATSGWSSLLSGTSRGALAVASPELMGIGRDISSVQLVSWENLPDWAMGESAK
jgi:hypothetical protein